MQEESVALGGPGHGVLIRPVPTGERPTPAVRPSFSVLDASSTWRALAWEPIHWRVAMRVAIRELLEAPDG